jgi:hypothetical protein
VCRGHIEKSFRGWTLLLLSIGFDFQFRSVCADSGPGRHRVPPYRCHCLNDWEASVVDEIDSKLVVGLVVLVAVADARSFVRAAGRLGMTRLVQPI